MKTKLHVFLKVLILLLLQVTFGQEKTISGSVNDQQGLPLPGVNVLIKGSTSGTQTDFDGNYSIRAKSGDILVFSYLGQKTVEQVVGSQNTINVQLEEDASQLEEVIVVGYGTQSKRTLTDNISKLTSDDISEVPNPNLQNALVAKAAGVQVTQTNGKVEGGINIRVRGAASVSGGTQPLYVLDGIPLIDPTGGRTDIGNGAPTNPLLTLSANEIESIDILKDASSAAIYGARGANGVVLITTKRGKQGKAKFSLNVSQGFSEPTNTRKWLNSAQYIELFTEAGRNSPFFTPEEGQAEAEATFDFLAGDTDWRSGEVDTNWSDIAFQNGYQSDADFSMSGADAKTAYFFSGAYNNTTGIIRGNELERANARVNLSHQLTTKFKAGMNMSFSRTEIDRIANDNAFSTPLQAIAQSPLSPARLDDGTPNPGTLYGNFLLDAENAFFKTIIRRTVGKAYGEYKFLPSLSLNSDFSYDLFSQTEDNFRGQNALFQSTNGEAFASDLGSESYTFSNYATFDKLFNDRHNINVVAGTEFIKYNRRITSVTSQQFPSDDLSTVSGGAEVTAGTGVNLKSSFLSYFARATYDLDGKYLLKASIRRDGSSRFGSNVRFGTFPAFSGGWIISEEDFLKSSETLSFLKLRASWGKLGNADIGGDYPSLFLFSGVSYNQRPGLAPAQPGNSNLTWEQSEQSDFGVEFGFLDNRISGELDYYKKDTKDLLFSVPLVPSSGASSINQNIGTLAGQGIEFVLNTKNIQTDNFSWSTNFNISKNTNELKSLPNENADIVTGRHINRVGESVAAFYLREYAGVDPANGDALYYLNTENPDGSINRDTTNDPDEAQRVVAGNPFPELTAGLTNTLLFDNFDFTFTFQGEWGASIYNGGGIYQSVNADYFDNQSIDQLNRWQQPGDITNIPQARLYAGNGTAHSTRFLGDADFIRLRNISLGYSLPNTVIDKMGLSKLRVYLTAINLLTITNYPFEDPEARSDVDGQNTPGETFYSSPPAKTVTVGVNINF
ncbi:SusC/RagA family TonB-linked outer membrane protein [Cellulophaga tyrosinoxydans]|uniref:TonB-linked outer membrane protein, SusC/RagA family n=1 Tax=Cellulophaga tyrosinoxydans TaxID=504486 RepID=A0A1W2AM00_9FLAO|nr:TonB-dependent receptor [Cellulophaga tyrosinoxydans]SMC61715.1 TonB-linked outer membrane protein, SusC/RagA family [Cellulophaga tyrosinoxydans]